MVTSAANRFFLVLIGTTAVVALALSKLVSVSSTVIISICFLVVLYSLMLYAFGIDRFLERRVDSATYGRNGIHKILDWLKRNTAELATIYLFLAVWIFLDFSVNVNKIRGAYKTDHYDTANAKFNSQLYEIVGYDSVFHSDLAERVVLPYRLVEDLKYFPQRTLDSLKLEQYRLYNSSNEYASRIVRDTITVTGMTRLEYGLLLRANTLPGFVRTTGQGTYAYNGIKFIQDDGIVKILENDNDSLNLLQRKIAQNTVYLNLANSIATGVTLRYPGSWIPAGLSSSASYSVNSLTGNWLAELLTYEDPDLSINQYWKYFIHVVFHQGGSAIFLFCFCVVAGMASFLLLYWSGLRAFQTEYRNLLLLFLQDEEAEVQRRARNLSTRIILSNADPDTNSPVSASLLSPAESPTVAQVGTLAFYKATGKYYEQLQEFPKALEAYTEGYQKFPEEPDFLLLRSFVYGAMGDTKQQGDLLQTYTREKSKLDVKRNMLLNFRITDLTLKAHPFYGDMTWRMNQKMNIILGRNGYGKSHLLSIILGLLQNDYARTSEFTNLSSETSLALYVERFDGKSDKLLPFTPEQEEQLNRLKDEARIEQENEYRIKNQTITFSTTGLKNLFGTIPILAIPDIRTIDRSRQTISKDDGELNLLENSAYHFLYQKPYSGIIGNTLYRICQTYADRKKNRLDIFRLMEDTFLRLTGSTFVVKKIVSNPDTSYDFLVQTEGSDSIQLPKVSQGTFSILAIVGIIYNYLRARYPNEPEDQITKKQAIVFIDEIDAHLHPDWQRKLMNILRDSFPEVQFFITAHSPLIIAGCKTQEVTVLRKRPNGNGFEMEYIPHDLIGYTIEELYQAIFQVETEDETFLKYKALTPFINDIEADIVKLQSKAEPTDEEKTRLAKLYDDLYYINIVKERASAQKEKPVADPEFAKADF